MSPRRSCAAPAAPRTRCAFRAPTPSTPLAGSRCMTTRAQIDRFFAGHRIGFAGVSTDPKHFSRTILRELETRGYEVVPIHPTAVLIADRTAYRHVYDVPGRLDGVLIMTPRSATAEIV